jgi:hypothetical protein
MAGDMKLGQMHAAIQKAEFGLPRRESPNNLKSNLLLQLCTGHTHQRCIVSQCELQCLDREKGERTLRGGSGVHARSL